MIRLAVSRPTTTGTLKQKLEEKGGTESRERNGKQTSENGTSLDNNGAGLSNNGDNKAGLGHTGRDYLTALLYPLSRGSLIKAIPAIGSEYK